MTKQNTLKRCWINLRARCNNPQHPLYSAYGGRGITVCERWNNSFADFWEDMEGSWAEGLELDRNENDKGYFPGNCSWVTRAENCRNTRSSKLTQEKVNWIRANPEGLTQVEMAHRLGIGKAMVNHVIKGLRW